MPKRSIQLQNGKFGCKLTNSIANKKLNNNNNNNNKWLLQR